MAGGNAKQQKAQQKALEKQKQKIVEDKTFGLKNKKSKSVQKYIKSVQQQITGQPPKDSDKYIAQQNKEKEEKNRIMQQKALIASLFKTTETVKQVSMESQKLYEPKQSRMDQKIDIYLDQRIQRSKEDDNMSNWDITTLEGVVQQKNTNACTTDIICKYFLQAVESKKYGWFWVCPNGGDDCKYRHCLPPGFVLASDVPQEVVDDEETLEEMIERQRRELPPGGEMVTEESFKRWKEEKEKGRLDELKDKVTKDSTTQLTGKDLFTFNPNLFMDDEGAADDFDYDEDIDLDELIRENEESLTKGNVLPDDVTESLKTLSL
ncbi:Zinc finger CCCH domain-containing protein 11 [Theileria parva strain Muguga]|uniref:C3H1-type domain-containing protein n=1 Tax=Theileria parva TaxID=5875 RepID=Q4N4G3_THEPA|nr:Zinc finger CCCH domain-containing protein 11 [Theileria parva strain Muguga]EAN32960.1 Zinc finger CCCH domain-containing protein 11 [Theileria parva strain Muguga]|eukprot:XP_765243.1 hypothetical protein [Theileria parva strain Muguga]